MADKISASPVTNPRALTLSDLMKKVREFGNKAQIPEEVPLLGGTKVGDMFFGKSPEELENWAYGNMPGMIPEMTNVPMLKNNRKESFGDALGMLPFAGPGGHTSQAMITAGGDPRLLLSRATTLSELGRVLNQQHYKMKHPSFAIQKEGWPEDFGNIMLLPHPRALDPKNNPNNALFNVDAHTGPNSGATRRVDTRLGSENSPDPDFALRIAASPRFNSFKDFENAGTGAKTLTKWLSTDPQIYNAKAFRQVMSALDDYDRDWLDALIANPKYYTNILKKDHPGLAKDISAIRRAGGVGLDHAELKVGGHIPLTGDNFQAAFLGPYAKYHGPDGTIKKLRDLGIEVREFKDKNLMVEEAMELQRSAKFTGGVPLNRIDDGWYHGGVDFARYDPSTPRPLENQGHGLWFTRDQQKAADFAKYDWATGLPKETPGVVHRASFKGKMATSDELKQSVDVLKTNWKTKYPDATTLQHAVSLDMQARGFSGVILAGDDAVIYSPDAINTVSKKMLKDLGK